LVDCIGDFLLNDRALSARTLAFLLNDRRLDALRDGWIERPEGRRSPKMSLSRMASVLISNMVTVVVGGSAKAARASGINIGYAIYFFRSLAYL
jgi:hypothetical protein